MIVRPLKGFDAFTAALRTGRRYTGGSVSLTVLAAESHVPNGTILMGVSVGKKTASKAVVRTRIRRLLREAVRSYVHQHHEALTEARITTLILIWRTAPSQPSLIHFSDVEHVVHGVIDSAVSSILMLKGSRG